MTKAMTMTQMHARGRAGWRRRLTRRARRLPLRQAGLISLIAAALFSLIEGPSALSSLVFLALAMLAADRIVWRHTRTQNLRARYRALGMRAEALDDRLHALRESEAVHRLLTETFGDLAVQLAPGRGAAGDITFANPRFRGLFPDATTLPVKFEGDAAEGETALETADGWRVLSWRAMPDLDTRGQAVIRWIARDVTAAVKSREDACAVAMEAERRAETKARFLAMAAHEIRNPLSGIAGMAELLATSDLDAHAASQVEAITRSSAMLQSVLDDLLDNARMEAERLVVEHEPYDLGAVLEDVCELAAPRVHEKGLDLACHIVRHGGGAVPRIAEGDAGRVRQIVANLVGNALKFTQSGGIQVLARTVTDGDGTRLSIEVSDSGPGLTAEEAGRIFDVFESGGNEAASQRLARRLGGVGLGLTISRRLATAMGGTLDVVSQEGEGSTFTLTLPGDSVERARTSTLEDREVLLVSASATLAAPLRRFTEERGGRLKVMAPESWAKRMADGRGWTRGPVLIDGPAEIDLPEGAVLLVRDAATRNPAARWLRLPWRAASLERALTGRADVDEVQPSVLRAAVDTGGPGLRVLVAEDDPVTQLLATAVLERAGHRVTLAATGHDAARLYREAAEAITHGGEPFAAALIDLNLTVTGETGMDGMAALRGIRSIERSRGLDPVPLHVVTGDIRPETALEAEAAGATSVLRKPVPVEVLASLLSDQHTDEEARML